jgi:hypothetical protein
VAAQLAASQEGLSSVSKYIGELYKFFSAHSNFGYNVTTSGPSYENPRAHITSVTRKMRGGNISDKGYRGK